MPELKFAVLFSAVDQLSDKLAGMGQHLMDFGNRAARTGEHISELGERLATFGERAALTGALVSEGADKLHEWSEAMEEPALSMERNMTTMAAMTGLSGEVLASIKERAVDFASVHPGVTAEEWVSGFTRMRGIFQDTTCAMQAEGTVAMLGRLGVESDAATRLIQVGWSNLHSTAAATGDQLTRTIQVFGLAPEQANQFAIAVGRMGASASAAHAPLSEVLALEGESSRLFGGGRGAMIFPLMIQGLETAAAKGKATIDFSHGLVAALQQLKAQLSGTPTEKLAKLADMGLGSQGPQLLKLLDNLDEVAAKQKQVAVGAGALGKAYGVATADAADQIQLLHQNVSNLYDAVYSPVLPTVNRWFSDLTGVVRGTASATEHHSTIARYAALSLTTLGGTAYYGVQGLSALGTMSVFAGRGLQAVKYALGLLDFESMALRLMYLKDGIMAIANTTTLWSVAQGALDLAMSPMFLIPAAIAAIGFAAYEIYQHWDKVSAFFKGLWTRVKGYFKSFETWLKAWGPTIGEVLLASLAGPLGLVVLALYKHWDRVKEILSDAWSSIKAIFSGAVDWLRYIGAKMIQALGEGIKAAALAPVHAMESVAGKIMALLPHSPAEAGPLRDLNRVHIVETIAETIHAKPLLSSIGAVAMAARDAMPSLLMPTGIRPIPAHDKAVLSTAYAHVFAEGTRLAAAHPLLAHGLVRAGIALTDSRIFAPTMHTLAGRIVALSSQIALAPPVPRALHAPEITLPTTIPTPAPSLSRAEEHPFEPDALKGKLRPGPPAAAPAGGMTINLNLHYAPVINGAKPDDWNSRRQADDIMRIVKDKLTREARLRFE
ncbi:MAG: hypothetical protein JO189_25395 [Deltaproteobacteria bacterium]|nr:hypothetical protein [Deltaproteobacteria bacterium]